MFHVKQFIVSIAGKILNEEIERSSILDGVKRHAYEFICFREDIFPVSEVIDPLID